MKLKSCIVFVLRHNFETKNTAHTIIKVIQKHKSVNVERGILCASILMKKLSFKTTRSVQRPS